ncbi:MAG TPA: PQQ-binding-like beta-propeller repeat protein [Planctomycetota bacterium]|nr:PQQ-binding-like beta-propeller repeat protein [Planctomycetota bacterium]HRR80873.1 PQQ-binding-like beta-propeller repeat protein [Planctomycetota bacterium]HRT94720.1 PQQ-binding-like beta-propeller repeat protein [Planctomycetota bacterium]
MRVPLSLAVALCATSLLAADWPTLRGNVARTGYVDAEIRPPFRLAWARHFVGERIGSAVEPIIADGKVFIGTHSGNLYALDAASGRPLWRLQAEGPILHSPAYASGSIMIAPARGSVEWLDADTGKPRDRRAALFGGWSVAPLIVEGKTYLWSRAGLYATYDPATEPSGQNMPVPSRQTAAFADGRVFVTGEDMRLRAFDARLGSSLWTSDPLVGQTARNYYPVIAKKGGRTVVIVRTNPVIQMSRLIAQDRHLLCQSAGVDDSDWKKVAAWIKTKEAMGTPELWEKEQAAICDYLAKHREAQTFFVLDAETGKLLPPPPVLWIAGCQGVGTPPVVLPDGRLLVFYRSVYGNWNDGVAPLVALGLLDLDRNRIEPLQHIHGTNPPWGLFWGTADESQNFLVARDTLIIIHQGTLSGFDLKTRQLFPIWGKRDTWGGFKNLPWARNEWHGPARSGVAIVGNRIYWQTGSRVLCIVSGEKGEPANDEGIAAASVPPAVAPPPGRPERHFILEQLRNALATLSASLGTASWAPLYVEPGLSGREFPFDDSGETFEALAWAFPHLEARERQTAKALLAKQWEEFPPFTRQAWYPLDKGERREPFWVPPDVLTPSGQPRPHHPFGNVYAVWLYAERCGEWDRVKAAWPQIKACFEDFARMNWKLDPERGDLYASRYLASLLAFARIAEKAGDAEAARQASALAEKTGEALVAWWKAVAGRITPRIFADIREWDDFIGKGNGLFFKIIAHKSKIALFHDLTPEVAALVRAKAPEAVEKVWTAFETLCPTWYLVGEERQVHFGENFVDPPDFALNAFKAFAWLRGAKPDELAARVDVPPCKADLAHLAKLAIALEAK